MNRYKSRAFAGMSAATLAITFAFGWPLAAGAASASGQATASNPWPIILTWLLTILAGVAAAGVALFGTWIYNPPKKAPAQQENRPGVPGYGNSAVYYAPRSFDHPVEKRAPLPPLTPQVPMYACRKEAWLLFFLGAASLLLSFTPILSLLTVIPALILLKKKPNYPTTRIAMAAICLGAVALAGFWVLFLFVVPVFY